LLSGRDLARPAHNRGLAPFVQAPRILLTPVAELVGGSGGAIVAAAS
jgi:hypothetical protein